MNDDQRADYQKFMDDERRMQEEERAAFLAAHPGYEQCPKHPERPVVNSGIGALRFCAECVEDHNAAHTDRMIRQDIERHYRGRVAGMGRTFKETQISDTTYEQVEK